MRPRTWVGWVATAAIVVGPAGCGRAGHAGSAAPPTPSSPASASATGVADMPVTGSLLQPGRYRYRDFRPAVTFRVPTGWEVGHRHPDFFDIWRSGAASLAFARPGFVIGGHGRVPTHGLSPRRVLDLLRHNPGVTRSKSVGDVAVGGRHGPALDIVTLPNAALFGGSDGAFHPGDVHTQIIALKVHGAIILVMGTSAYPPDKKHLQMVGSVEHTVHFSS